MLIGIFLAFDLPARQRFAVVNDEVERVRAEVMEPVGAVERIEGDRPDIRGNGVFGSLRCYLASCPIINRQWFVPIQPGKEEKFMKSILQTGDYQIESEAVLDCTKLDVGNVCSTTGRKGNLSMSARIYALGDVKAPTHDVSPKQWRLVGLEVVLY